MKKYIATDQISLTKLDFKLSSLIFTPFCLWGRWVKSVCKRRTLLNSGNWFKKPYSCWTKKSALCRLTIWFKIQLMIQDPYGHNWNQVLGFIMEIILNIQLGSWTSLTPRSKFISAESWNCSFPSCTLKGSSIEFLWMVQETSDFLKHESPWGCIHALSRQNGNECSNISHFSALWTKYLIMQQVIPSVI